MSDGAVTAPEMSPDHVRAALRRAARALVEEGGLSAATTRAVVQRAFGHERAAMLYAYYAGMDGLLEDTANEALEQVGAEGAGGLGALSDACARLVMGHATAWLQYTAARGGDLEAVRTEIGACLLGLRGA